MHLEPGDDWRKDKAIRRQIKEWVKSKFLIHQYEVWDNRGYHYNFSHSYHSDAVGEERLGWHITAGCRRWSSFRQMERHYDDPYWREEYAASERKRCLDEIDVIMKLMKRFAKEFGIKLAGEKRRKKKR